jgi:hypothetical protein
MRSYCHAPSAATLVLVMLAPAAASGAGSVDYFVAVDNLETIATGTYAGLPNPNFARLTLFVAHRSAEDPTGNHFHAIGPYTYTGIEGGPAFEIPTSTNNRIPEISTGFLPLLLHPGTDGHRRHFVSLPTESEYTNLRIASIQSLADFPPDSPDGLLFRSSAGRWVSRLDGSQVALQRVSLTSGLHVSDEDGRPILLERLQVLGDGNTLALFPTYLTNRLTPVGTYSATLKLVDLRPSEQRFGDSGRFTFDFRVAKRGDLDGATTSTATTSACWRPASATVRAAPTTLATSTRMGASIGSTGGFSFSCCVGKPRRLEPGALSSARPASGSWRVEAI